MTEDIETAMSGMAIVQNEHDPTIEVPNRSGTHNYDPSVDSRI